MSTLRDMLADSMSDVPAVSVVVPFFSSEQHIEACIESLLGQRNVEGSYEIILINNRSTDASASIAKRYSSITLLEEDKPGAYAARNTGIRRARAPLVAFTDADCAADPDWLRSIQDRMRDEAIAVLVGHLRYPDNASPTLALIGAYENAKAAYVIGRCDAAYHFAYSNNMAVRASVFEELGPFKEWKRAADSELVQRLAQLRPDLRLAYCPSMRVTHLEFVRGRLRAKRLRLYARTNSKIETFRELGVAQRAGVLMALLRGVGKSQ